MIISTNVCTIIGTIIGMIIGTKYEYLYQP